MGTSKSAAELAGKMQRVGEAIPKASEKGIRDSSQAGKLTIQAIAAQRRVPPTARLAGRKWSVRYDVRTVNGRASSLLRILGAFPLVESDTPAHKITARRAPGSRSRRRTGKRALVINGNVRASAQHPGTRGKHIFRDAKAKIIKDSPPTVMRNVVADMSKVLK